MDNPYFHDVDSEHRETETAISLYKIGTDDTVFVCAFSESFK